MASTESIAVSPPDESLRAIDDGSTGDVSPWMQTAPGVSFAPSPPPLATGPGGAHQLQVTAMASSDSMSAPSPALPPGQFLLLPGSHLGQPHGYSLDSAIRVIHPDELGQYLTSGESPGASAYGPMTPMGTATTGERRMSVSRTLPAGIPPAGVSSLGTVGNLTPMSYVSPINAENYFQQQKNGSRSLQDKSRAFRMFFKVPESERLIDDFSCAVKGKILLHGRLYISQNYVCFYSNIFGHKTKLVIDFKSITAIKKRRLAKVIPNSIEIVTTKSKYFFSSFMFRNQTFKMLAELWTIHLKLQGKDPSHFLDDSEDEDGSDVVVHGTSESSSSKKSPSRSKSAGKSPHKKTSDEDDEITATDGEEDDLSNRSSNNDGAASGGAADGGRGTASKSDSASSCRGSSSLPSASTIATASVVGEASAAASAPPSAASGARGHASASPNGVRVQGEAAAAGGLTPVGRSSSATNDVDEWDDGYEMAEEGNAEGEDVNVKDLPREMQAFLENEDPPNMKEVVRVDIRIPLRKMFDLLMSDQSPFTKDYHIARGDFDVEVLPWQSYGPKFGSLRDVRCRSPVKIPFGPKSTRMFFTERYYWVDSKRLRYEITGYSADVPFGDSFRVESRWEFVESADRKLTTLTIELGCRFIKSTMWKGKITDGVFKETTASYERWSNMAQELIEKERKLRSARKLQRKSSKLGPGTAASLVAAAAHATGEAAGALLEEAPAAGASAAAAGGGQEDILHPPAASAVEAGTATAPRIGMTAAVGLGGPAAVAPAGRTPVEMLLSALEEAAGGAGSAFALVRNGAEGAFKMAGGLPVAPAKIIVVMVGAFLIGFLLFQFLFAGHPQVGTTQQWVGAAVPHVQAAGPSFRASPSAAASPDPFSAGQRALTEALKELRSAIDLSAPPPGLEVDQALLDKALLFLTDGSSSNAASDDGRDGMRTWAVGMQNAVQKALEIQQRQWSRLREQQKATLTALSAVGAQLQSLEPSVGTHQDASRQPTISSLSAMVAESWLSFLYQTVRNLLSLVGLATLGLRLRGLVTGG